MTKFIKDALTSKWLLAVSRLWRDKAKKSQRILKQLNPANCGIAMTKKVGFSVLSNLRDLSRNLRDKVHHSVSTIYRTLKRHPLKEKRIKKLKDM